MYKLEFIDMTDLGPGGIYAVYTLTPDMLGNDLTLTPKQLVSSDYSGFQPSRLSVSCFSDTWLSENLLSGNYELPNQISIYKVRLYRQRNQSWDMLFTGVIDTGNLQYNLSTNQIKLVCYDMLYLLSLYADINYLFTLRGGYSALLLLNIAINQVNLEAGLRLSFSSAQPPARQIPVTNQSIFTTSFDELLQECGSYHLPPSGTGYPENRVNAQLQELRAGMAWADELPCLVMLARVNYSCGYGNNQSLWSCYAGQIHVFYNHSCVLSQDITTQSLGWYAATSASINYQVNSFANSWLYISGLDYNTPFPTSVSQNGNTWSVTQDGNDATVSFSGNLAPASIYPKGYYDDGTTKQPLLQALKTALSINGQRLVCHPSGAIDIAAISPDNTPALSLNRSQLVSYIQQRLSVTLPGLQSMQLLCGDSEILTAKLQQLTRQDWNGRWQITATIASSTAPALLQQLHIENRTWVVVEVQPHINGENTDTGFYNIVAWEVI